MSHLTFNQLGASASGKTKVYAVKSEFDDSFLGQVQWHSHWRAYCFFPQDECVWSYDCLEELAAFLRKINKEHKEARNG